MNDTQGATPDADMLMYSSRQKRIPVELLYNGGIDEYYPEMPSAFDNFGLSPAISGKLEELLEYGICSFAELEGRVLQELSTVPEHMGLMALQELLGKDRSAVRNPEGFLMGVLKRMRNEMGQGPPAYMPVQKKQRIAGAHGPPVQHFNQAPPHYQDSPFDMHRGPYNPQSQMFANSFGGYDDGPGDIKHRINMEISRNVQAGVIREEVVYM